MSLDLYHWEPNADSARALICLKEKRLDFVSHYVDLLKFEQHAASFLALNPRGQVPVLLHDGAVITESSYIAEYLEESFPEIPLMPADALGRWQVRVWQKFVDERLAPAVGLMGWQLGIGPSVRRRLVGRTADVLSRIPAKERRDVWTLALDEKAMEEKLPEYRRKLEAACAEIETALSRSPWLAGPQYSLADIAVFSMLRGPADMLSEWLDARGAPRMRAWLSKMQDRPAVNEALAFARVERPHSLFVPGPEEIRWG